jgi:ankyrin repeat protein
MKGPLQPLIEAILEDNRERARELLKQDNTLAKARSRAARLEWSIAHWVYAGDTALHVAAAGYRVEIAKTLLAAGADAGAVGKHRHSQPLHYASDGHVNNPAWNPKRQVAMIRLLIEAGADVHAQDKNGATPLHRAVRTRCADAVKCLLDSGAAALIKNKPGSTPFHLAVQNTGRGGSGAELAKAAQRGIIRTFLERGVSPRIKDQQGKSVLDWARSEWVRQLLAGNCGRRTA